MERAKQTLMRERQLSESEAYAALRKTAMDQGLSIEDVARRLLVLHEQKRALLRPAPRH